VKNNWPDNLTIQQYLEGSLDKKLMHELEKRALEDPFLADALEGYAHVSTSDHGLSILQRQLHERISHHQENKKVFDLSWQRLSIAAAAAVMFITAGVLFWMNGQLPHQKTAANSKRVEVNITPVESLDQDGAIVRNSEEKAPVIEPAETKPLYSTKQYNNRPVVRSKVAGSRQNRQLTAALVPRSDSDLANEKDIKPQMVVKSGDEVKLSGGEQTNDSMKVGIGAAPPTLAEVVVSRFDSPAVPKASPVDGWEAYRRYLQENINKASLLLKQKGKVILAFKVSELGKLTDFTVLKGLSGTADSLAIQIIKSGPSWKPAVDGKVSELRIELDF
jgi:hypothetical protein